MPDLKSEFEQLRAAAAGYPESYEERPWGELAAKVNKKVFCFLGRDDGARLGFSLKLPESRNAALELPQTSPTGYGLGRHGWVSFGFEPGEEVPMDRILDWLDESYRAVAPKRLVRALELPVEEPEEETQPPPSLTGHRLLLVGDDPLRLKRASEALVSRAADPLSVPLDGALDAAATGDPSAVIIDLSRNARRAIALLPEIGLICECPVFVAGVRDAPMERELGALERLGWISREPPGAPLFLLGLVERLG